MAEAALSEESAVDGPLRPIEGTSGEALGKVRWRTEVVAVAVCIVFGVVISMLPYGLWWGKIGQPVWMADNDELFYLQFASQAYFHHLGYLSDSVVPDAVTRNTYPWITLGPGIIAARLLDTGPLMISFFWRLEAGVGIAVMTYLLLRHFLGRPLVAMVLACLLMSDVGMSSCHLVVKQWMVAVKILTGHAGVLLSGHPLIHPMWRIVNPGPSLPFLLLHVLLVARARERPTPLRLALSAAGFGILFYIYFYYYTATCLALALAFALDAGHRRVYFHTLWAGGLIGLPGVISTYLFQKSVSSDWLNRTDKFLPLPHFSQLMIPTVASVLLIIGLTWVALRRRDLTYLGLLGLSGLGLANHLIVTGLEIENFHWNWVWGPMISYLTVILAASVLTGPISGSRRWVGVFLGLWVIHLGVGLWLRGVEVTRTRQPRELVGEYLLYEADCRSEGAVPLVPNSVIAGDQRYVNYATILEDQRPFAGYAIELSPYVDNASWAERVALNNYLLGLDISEFEIEQRHLLEVGKWGPWARDPVQRRALLERRLAAFRAVENDCRPALSRYKVRYVALPEGRALPARARSRWKKVRAGTTWDVMMRIEGDDPPLEPAAQPR